MRKHTNALQSDLSTTRLYKEACVGMARLKGKNKIMMYQISRQSDNVNFLTLVKRKKKLKETKPFFESLYLGSH